MNDRQTELQAIGNKIREMEAKKKILEMKVGFAVANNENSDDLYTELKNVRNGIKFAKEIFKTKSKVYMKGGKYVR